MNKPNSMPPTMCLAPWTHTYLSPQTERRMCCASREPAQNFAQYIDMKEGTGIYHPMTLEEHWNSEHMKNVRKKMMNGETLSECDVCNSKLLNTDVYRSYFNKMFAHHYDEIWENTDETGHTTLKPVSWDYRFSNLCNFKCRMCGDMLSSAWETEELRHNMINWDDPKNNWMLDSHRMGIYQFQNTQVEKEFSEAIEEKRIEEIYWVGGEPLMFEQHWKYMSRVIELGLGPNVYARYNTNLSRINYKGINLYKDILVNLKDWQVCASLDGTGAIGEYIRTGLNYNDWLNNFKEGLAYTRHPRQLRVDFTLTLPGMFEIENIIKLAKECNVDILAKVVFSFSPNIILSPLALPRNILDTWVDELLPMTYGAMHDVLLQLKNRPTFEEQWPNSYKNGLIEGKERIMQLEKIRKCDITMYEILNQRPLLEKWWNNIES